MARWLKKDELGACHLVIRILTYYPGEAGSMPEEYPTRHHVASAMEGVIRTYGTFGPRGL